MVSKNHKAYPENTRKNEVVFLTTWQSFYFLKERSVFGHLENKNLPKMTKNEIFGVIFGGYERYIFLWTCLYVLLSIWL